MICIAPPERNGFEVTEKNNIAHARCYFCYHKSCFSKVIKPKAVNARINPTATIAVF